jgi:lipopolysaccharide/colanic/teichoic acid biosynthesis glycosyltransferase
LQQAKQYVPFFVYKSRAMSKKKDKKSNKGDKKDKKKKKKKVCCEKYLKGKRCDNCPNG